MPIIESRINTRSQDYTDNARAMQAQLDDLNQQLARTALGGNEAARAKHVARGKLLPRDRVEQLIDPGSPFLELSPMARTACMKARRRAPASSPASAACRARNA